MIPYLTVFGLIWDALHQLCDRFRGTVVAQRGESVARYVSQDFIYEPVPMMQHFSVQFSLLDSIQTIQRLNEAILQAIAHLQFLAGYINSVPTDDCKPLSLAPIAS